MALHLAYHDEANALLERDPFALLVGMLLDQQIPLEKAFTSPYELRERLGHDLDPKELAGYGSEALVELFAQRPALHRFPKAMAARVQELARQVADRYDGDAARVWSEAKDGKDLLRRVADLPGFGQQKAQIFVALLGKQFGVQPKGWRAAAGEFGAAGSHKSVADIVDADSLQQVRTYKQQMKAAAKAGKSAP
jgi:uncharacterized HhH-GPD family protein